MVLTGSFCLSRIVIRVKSIFSREGFTFGGNYDALVLLLLIAFIHLKFPMGRTFLQGMFNW